MIVGKQTQTSYFQLRLYYTTDNSGAFFAIPGNPGCLWSVGFDGIQSKISNMIYSNFEISESLYKQSFDSQS